MAAPTARRVPSSSRLRHRSASLVILATIALVAGIVVTAVAADGRENSRATTNDGGAWLVNRSLGVVGHKNRASGELSSFTRVVDSPTAEVLQSSGMTVVFDRATRRLYEIDPRTLVPDLQPTELPESTTVRLLDDGVLVIRQAPLTVWWITRHELAAMESLRGHRPILEHDEPGLVTATHDGLIAAVVAGQLQWLGPTGPQGAPVDLGIGEAVIDATIVGTTAVTVAQGGHLALVDEGGEPVNLDWAETGLAPIDVLQEPSVVPETGVRARASRVVGVALDGTMIEVLLDPTGAVIGAKAMDRLDGSGTQRPIVHDGCVYVLMADPASLATRCDRLDVRELDGAGRELRMRLVNNWIWVNDLDSGGAWVSDPDHELGRLDDWGLAVEGLEDEQDDRSDSGGAVGDTELVEDPDALGEVHRDDEYDPTEANVAPVANPDTGRTRSGQSVAIPVLDNDTDANNDILAVVGIELVSGSATVDITPDRTGVQITPAPGFTGEIVVRYSVSDGRAGPVETTVTVEVTEPDAPNNPPVTVTDVIATSPGAGTTIDVLRNDWDPDGDSMALVAVEAESGTVLWSPTGQVTFTPDTTTSTGWIEVDYVVRDDLGAEADGLLRVEIRDGGANQEPDARNDHAITVVDRPVVIDILANDTDPDGDTLLVGSRPRLLSPAGATPRTTTSVDGEFVFSSDVPGTFLFSYTVTDSGEGGSEHDSARIRVDVEPIDTNSPPVAVRDDLVVPVGESRIAYVLENDGDPDGDVIGIVDWQSASGLVIDEFVDETGHVGFWVTVTPTAPDRSTFSYSISDGTNDPVEAQVVVAAVVDKPRDQPPIAADDIVEVRAGRSVEEIPVLANDFDPEGKPLRVVGVTETDSARAEVSPDRQTVSIHVDASATASFDLGYDIEDVAGNRAAAVIRVQLIDPGSPNRPPVARADTARTATNRPVAIDVLANDSDPDGDVIGLEGIVDQPGNGSAIVVAGVNTIQYQPDPGFAGTDLLRYAIVDELGERAIGEVFIGVVADETINLPPIANDDSYALAGGPVPIPLNVLANDFDPESDPLRVVSVTAVDVGDIVIDEFGRVTYTGPERLEAETTVTFTYTIVDTADNRASATVTVTLPAYGIEEPTATPEPTPTPTDSLVPATPVATPTLEPTATPEPSATPTPEPTPTPTPEATPTATPTPTPTPDPTESNLPPVAVADEIGPVLAGSQVQVPVLANDFDPDGEPGELTIVSVDAGWTIEGDTIVGTAGEETTVVEYTIADRFEVQASATVTVLVAVNQAPIVEPLSLATAFETPIRVVVSDQVTDPDGDTVFFICCDGIRGGLIDQVTSAAGVLEFTFTPETGFVGTAGLSYGVDDQNGHQTSGSVVIEVAAPDNRPPIAVGNTVTVPQDETVTLDLAELSTDPDDDDLTWSIERAPDDPGLSVELAGSVASVSATRETPEGSSESFEFVVSDGAESAQATVTINVVTGANRAPEAGDTAIDIAAASSATVDLAGLASDPDPGDSLTFTLEPLQVDNVVATVAGSVLQVAISAAHEQVAFDIDYRASDTRGESAVGTVTITVTEPQEPPPAATDDDVSTSPGVAVDVDVLANDVDPLGEGLRVISASAADGSAAVVADGARVRFDPEDFVGDTTATYTISDAAGREATGTIRIETVSVPDQPAPPDVRADAGAVTLTWTAPQANGRPITGYTITLSTGESHQVGVQNTFRWDGLTNGDSYTFTVTAHNEMGASEPSEPSLVATPDIVPEAPASPSVLFGDGQLSVSWSAPTNNGSDLVGYELELGGASSGTQSVGLDTDFVWTGLTNGSEYTFRVRARNGAGFGPWSPASAPEHPETVPAAPTITSVERAGLSGALDITWTEPNDGGGQIIEYRITSDAAGSATVSGSDALTYSWSNLPNGQQVQFRIQARNRAGWGPESALSAPVVPCGFPDAPGAPTVTRGDTQVAISWSPPADNGCGVTSYVITNNVGGSTRETAGTGLTWTGLTNGTSYTFTVRAENELGWSPDSAASAAVIPAGPPICGSAIVTAAPSAPGELTVSWSAAIDNGSPIIGYDLGVGAPADIGADGNLSWTHTGLANGTSYTYRLRASNDVGTSPECSQTTATTWDLPTPVSATLAFDPGTETITATLSGGVSTEPPVLDYVPGWEQPDGLTIESSGHGAPPRTHTFNPTQDGIHSFHIQICNAVGCVETPANCCTVEVLLPAPPDQMDPPTFQWTENRGTGEDFNVWTEGIGSPPNDNNSPITGYGWESAVDTGSGWSQTWMPEFTDDPGPVRTNGFVGYTVDAWIQPVQVRARVRAINAEGEGPWSDWAEYTVPFQEPHLSIYKSAPLSCGSWTCEQVGLDIRGFGTAGNYPVYLEERTDPGVNLCPGINVNPDSYTQYNGYVECYLAFIDSDVRLRIGDRYSPWIDWGSL